MWRTYISENLIAVMINVKGRKYRYKATSDKEVLDKAHRLLRGEGNAEFNLG